MTTQLPVAGHCPMGCGQTLHRTDAGPITCTSPRCPRPDAADMIIGDQETEHIVQFDPTGFTIRHPLRERLDDHLMHCDLHRFCAGLPGPPSDGCGRYKATEAGIDGWTLRRTTET